jgi:sialate O-acetylesterase
MIALLLAPAFSSLQSVLLPSVISSNMVLQRNTTAPLWGWALPGSVVSVKTSWNSKTSITTAGEDGRFMVKVKTGNAGGPYTIQISAGRDTETVNGVLLGEVWLCSGQSNMWWPLGPHQGLTQIEGGKAEVDLPSNPNLRFFTVGQANSSEPQKNCKGSWLESTSEAKHNISASAYFFGKALETKLKVPIGLIVSAVGGTESELWTSREKLMTIPEFARRIEPVPGALAEFQKQDRIYKDAVAKLDSGRNTYIKTDFEDTAWQTSEEPSAWSTNSLKSYDGVVYYRKSIQLTSSQAAGAATLELGSIDDNDVTYLNGRVIGATEDYSVNRSYRLSAGTLVEGTNVIVVRIEDTGGDGGFYSSADALRIKLGDGSVFPLTGTWKWHFGPGSADIPARPTNNVPNHSTLYNGMIAPLIPYAIKGAIWYQGESNVSRAMQYRTAFPAMIQDWRTRFGRGDFPFYFVQIAPFPYSNNGASCELREAQTLTLKLLKNTGMAVISDVTPNVNDIHPSKKREVGDRLALLALSRLYGFRQADDQSPTYRSMKVEGSTIRITFNNLPNGFLREKMKVEGFTISGASRRFYPADAIIDGKSIVVSAKEVQEPLAVRFLWTDTAMASLFSSGGLPVSSFRTDNWPGVTEKVFW